MNNSKRNEEKYFNTRKKQLKQTVWFKLIQIQDKENNKI